MAESENNNPTKTEANEVFPIKSGLHSYPLFIIPEESYGERSRYFLSTQETNEALEEILASIERQDGHIQGSATLRVSDNIRSRTPTTLDRTFLFIYKPSTSPELP